MISRNDQSRGVEAAPATAPVPPPTAAPTAAPGAHPTGSVTMQPMGAPMPAPVAAPAAARAAGSAAYEKMVVMRGGTIKYFFLRGDGFFSPRAKLFTPPPAIAIAIAGDI